MNVRNDPPCGLLLCGLCIQQTGYELSIRRIIGRAVADLASYVWINQVIRGLNAFLIHANIPRRLEVVKYARSF